MEDGSCVEGCGVSHADTRWSRDYDQSKWSVAREDQSAMEWCLSHYGEGNGFIIPKVTVVSGAEKGMEVMKSVADGKSSLEKFAIQHPL